MSDKMKQKLISVIIPIYNYGHFIPDTLNCLINQSYIYWECIVIDDGSTDNTKEVVASFIEKDDRIKYYYQTNKGQSVAKNLGLKLAVGKYIQFLDADDVLENKKFENQLKIFETDENIDIVYSNVRFFNSDKPSQRLFSMDSVNKPWMIEFTGFGHELLPNILRGNTMVINSPLFKASLLVDVGFIILNKGFNEDWDFWLRCSFKNKYFYYDNNESSLALVRIHSASSSKNTLKMYQAGLSIRKKIRLYLKQIQDVKFKTELEYLNEELLISTIRKTIEIELNQKKFIESLLTLVQNLNSIRDFVLIKYYLKVFINIYLK